MIPTAGRIVFPKNGAVSLSESLAKHRRRMRAIDRAAAIGDGAIGFFGSSALLAGLLPFWASMLGSLATGLLFYALKWRALLRARGDVP